MQVARPHSMRSYYGRVLGRARDDGWAMVKEHLVFDALLIALPIIVGIATFDGYGWKSATVLGLVSFLAAVGLVFFWSLAWAPVNLDREQAVALWGQAADIEKLKGSGEDDVTKAITRLKDRTYKVIGIEDRMESETAYLLLLECGALLNVGGLNPKTATDWATTYKGMKLDTLVSFLGQLRIWGIAEVDRQSGQSEDGYPYMRETFFLTPFGAKVLAQIEADIEREFGGDSEL